MNFAKAPGYRVTRDGRRLDARSLDEWHVAFLGHKKDAHKGKEVPTCPACREIKEKLK